MFARSMQEPINPAETGSLAKLFDFEWQSGLAKAMRCQELSALVTKHFQRRFAHG